MAASIQNSDMAPLDFLFVWFMNNNQGTQLHNKEVMKAKLLSSSMKNALYISKKTFSSYSFAVKKS